MQDELTLSNKMFHALYKLFEQFIDKTVSLKEDTRQDTFEFIQFTQLQKKTFSNVF